MSTTLTADDLLCIKTMIREAVTEAVSAISSPTKGKSVPVSIPEACAATGCKEAWLRDKLNQGEIKGFKLGTSTTSPWRVFPEEVTRFITARSNQKKRR